MVDQLSRQLRHERLSQLNMKPRGSLCTTQVPHVLTAELALFDHGNHGLRHGSFAH